MKIKPVYPLVGMIVTFFFVICSVALFLSPYSNITMQLLAAFMLSMGIFFFLLIDQSYISVNYDSGKLYMSGFFGIKRININADSVLGYEIQQRVDEFNGLHDMVVLVIKDNKRIVFPKIAYSDYRALKSFFEANFKFLGYCPLRFAEFFKKWVPIFSFISGLLALLVALQKIL